MGHPARYWEREQGARPGALLFLGCRDSLALKRPWPPCPCIGFATKPSDSGYVVRLRSA